MNRYVFAGVSAAALVLAGCGSDGGSGAGAAGGIYGSEFGINSLVVDENFNPNIGVVAENGRAYFVLDEGDALAIGKVNGKNPAVPDEDGIVRVPIGGNFTFYLWNEIEEAYQAVGKAQIDKSDIDVQDEDFCNTGEWEPEEGDPKSFLDVEVDVDGGEEGDAIAVGKAFCLEAEADFDGDDVRVGVSGYADLELYEDDGDDGWTLDDLVPAGLWTTDGGGLSLDFAPDGSFDGLIDGCDIEGTASQVREGLNAFQFSAVEECEDETIGLKGMMFIDPFGDLFVFVQSGDFALYFVLQDVEF